MERAARFCPVLLLLLLFCLITSEAHDKEQNAYVVLDSDGKTPVVKHGLKPSSLNALAWGHYRNHIPTTGWSYLKVKTNGSYTDYMQAFAAGMTEGVLTGDLIYEGYKNTLADYCKAESDFCAKLDQFLGDNLKWMMEQIANNPDDRYWHQVNVTLTQFEGLKEGYRALQSLPNITDFGFLLMQVDGDLEDLEQVLGKTERRHVFGSGSCSALIKLLPGNKDLFISQVTWTSYYQMLRVFKRFDTPYSVKGGKEKIAGSNMSFSSYPGSLTSGDDFYMLSSGLVSQETTIGNSNPKLWKYVTPEGVVLEWMRSIVANRLARTTEEWAYIFSKYNSGTYNNQWMILDYKLFTPGQPIKPGTLRILEQLPGIIESADMSVFLQEHSYWPSYNIPYFPYVYNMSGAMDSFLKFGSWFNYERHPRARIFRRDHDKVVDMKSMMKLMRYNDYMHDPMSRCNCTPPYSAENAISARSDLNPSSGKYPFGALKRRSHGGIDAKITNSGLVKDLQCMAVSGPTHDQQPVFKWSTSNWTRPLGHPDAWDFEPLTITWDFN